MRICPVCHARAFDDAEICYGCMHRFGIKDAAASPVPGGAHKGGNARSLPKEAQMCVQMPISGQSAAPWADAQQVDLAKGRSAEQPKAPTPGDGASSTEQRLDSGSSAGEDDVARRAAQAAACQLLRRGRPVRGSNGARPADVQRGASAGQGAEQARPAYPRHAAELQEASA